MDATISNCTAGLSQPSSIFEVNVLLTNYLPTVFATLIEPFWVILTRMLCLLQPFYDLLSDRGSAERTIKSRYMALPPQLALWRAFKLGHVLLGLLCITALWGNILSVGLGAMFNDRPTETTIPVTMVRQNQTMITIDRLSQFTSELTIMDDKFYTARANLSYGTPLPPWMTSEYSFLPINITEESRSGDSHGVYTGITMGFGVEPRCKALNFFDSTNEPPHIDPSFYDVQGNFTTCARNLQPETFWFNSTLYTPPSGPCSAESINTFSPTPFLRAQCADRRYCLAGRAQTSHITTTA